MRSATVCTTLAMLGAAVPALGQSYYNNLQGSVACGTSFSDTNFSPGYCTRHLHTECLFNGNQIGSINDTTATILSAPGLVRADGYAWVDHRGTTAWNSSAAAYQETKFTATDVVFSEIDNPTATGTIQASMNLVIKARYIPVGLSNCDPFDPRGWIYFFVECPFDSTTRLTGQRQSFGADFTETGDIAAIPNDGSPTFVTSSSRDVHLDHARELFMSVSGSGSAGYCDRPPAAIGSVEDFIEVSLPRGTPVFNLPPGYTANSVQANIVNNIWQGPCPADYNGDGFVDGIDYDNFMNDFENPDPLQQRRADYNHDGFVDGIDYDSFVNDFETPC